MSEHAYGSARPSPNPASDEASVALLIEFLSTRDSECPRCGYNLRGLQSAKCPECGDELALRVALAEPRLASYISLLIAWAAGLGGGLFFSVIALIYAPPDWWWGIAGASLCVQVLSTATGLALTLGFRRRIRRWRPRVQWNLALGAWVIVLLLSAFVVRVFEP